MIIPTMTSIEARIVARRLRRVLSLDDFEGLARAHLPKPLFAYVSGGVEANKSLRDNRHAFDEVSFIPRILNNVSGRSQTQTLLGNSYASPFGIAPMGISALTAYQGDIVQAVAAEKTNIPMIMSGSSLIPLEQVARAAPNAWFQAYLPGGREAIAALVDRVAKAGFRTLVVTADTAVLPNRENNIRAGFHTPLRPSASLLLQGVTHLNWTITTLMRTLIRHGMPHFENNSAVRGAPIFSSSVTRDFRGRDHLDWDDLRRIRAQWSGHLVLKGVLNREDAVLARDCGVDGVIVSNHGGRQLDSAVAPIRVLSSIVAAVPDMTVMIDSGFRRGTDVLKALSMGARCVFIGRPFNYAAAVGGERGVLHAINLLSAELSTGMALLGVNTLDQLGKSHLLSHRETPL